MTNAPTTSSIKAPTAGTNAGDRLRVLLVSSSSGSQGGGELYLEGLAEGLMALGHEVESLLAAHTRMDALASKLGRFGRVHRADFPNTYDRRTRAVGSVLARRTIARLAGLFGDLRPDVLHLNKQNLEDGLDLLLAAGRTGLPTVCTVHVTRGMTGLGSMFGGVRDWVARRTLQRARCEYIAVAEAGTGPFLTAMKGAVPADRVHTIWNGIRTVAPGDREAVRAEWGCGPNDVVIGCVARLEAEKSPLFALELLARLPAHVRLAWVGDGRQRDEFLRTATELGVAGRVHLDGWRNDARQRMAGLDIFILPSVYEFFPFAVLEAMAAGLPCVTSHVGGISEAVTNGETGWLCTPRATDEWLAKLNELVASGEGRAQMGEAGRKRVEESFSLDAMARGTAAVYETAIRRAAQRTTGVS
jgi:glycosyltransferase involved in cell wall biosynthesis